MTEIFKQKLSLLVTFFALIIALVGFLYLNLSLAWFAKNEAVDADGLSVNAEVSPNLVIGSTVEEITGDDIIFSITLESNVNTNMIAVTRDEDADGSYLKYLESSHGINRQSGLAEEGVTPEFLPVPASGVNGEELYFVDYTVYIASALKELPIDSLKASIVSPENVDDDHSFFNAASIDFYLGSGASDNYCGTATVAGDASVEIMGEGTIPLNKEGYITVIMRCYFDGALTYDGGEKAYINSANVNTDEIILGVAFVAEDKTQQQ